MPQPSTTASDDIRITRDISLRRIRKIRATKRRRDCREIADAMRARIIGKGYSVNSGAPSPPGFAGRTSPASGEEGVSA